MPSIKDIRSRIGSVKNTQQITKAMKMVAASKLRRAQEAIEGARSYSGKLEDISNELLAGLLKSKAGSSEKAQSYLSQLHPLLSEHAPQENEKRTIALVAISSDRGLCGAYNTNVVKASWKAYNELIEDETLNVKVYTVGRKVADFFRNRGIETTSFPDVWQGRFNIHSADKVTHTLVDSFKAGEIQEVRVVYTEFQSALTQTLKTKKVLPMTVDLEELFAHKPEAVENSSAPYMTDPAPQDLFGSLLPVQLRMQVFALLADSLASEYGSRMTAMDNATRNAGEMITSLTLQANRLRQAAITTELMEIIGGAEALNG